MANGQSTPEPTPTRTPPPTHTPLSIDAAAHSERGFALLSSFASMDDDPKTGGMPNRKIYGYAQAHRNRDRLLRAPLAPRFVRGRDLVRLTIVFALVVSIVGTAYSNLPEFPAAQLGGSAACLVVIGIAFYALARYPLSIGWRTASLVVQLVASLISTYLVFNGSTYLYTTIPICVVACQIQVALRNHFTRALLLTGGGLLADVVLLFYLDAQDWDARSALPIILVVLTYLFVVVLTRFAVRDMLQRRRILSVLDDLRRSDERYRLVTDRANDAIYIVEPDGKLSYVNQRMSDMLDLDSRDALIGAPLADFLAPEDRPRVLESLIGAPGGEAMEMPTPVQAHMIRRDGARLTVEINAVSFYEDNEFKGRVGIARNITERRRMQEQIERRNRDLAVLNAVGSVASRSLDLDRQLNDVVNTLVEIFNADVVAINPVDQQSGLLRVASYRGLSPQEIAAANHSIKLGVGLVGSIAQSGKSVLIEDIQALDNPTIVQSTTALGLRSYMGSPLRSDDRLLGVVTVYSRRPRAFSRDDHDLLVSIANQVGLSIEKARLYGTSISQVRELSCLAEIAKALNVSQSLDQTLKAISAAISQSLGYRAATILLTDPNITMVSAHGSYGLPPSYDALLTTAPVRDDPSMQNSALFSAVRSREPVFVRYTDIANTTEFRSSPLAPLVERVGWKSVIAVPLIYQDQVLGAMACFATSDAEPPDGELRLLTTIANQTSLAVRNTTLFQDQQRRADQLRTLNEIDQRIGAILSVDELMPYVTRTLHETFDYYNVAIFLLSNDDTHELILKAASGWEADRTAPGWTLHRDETSINAWVANNVEPLLINDVSRDPRYHESSSPGIIRAELCVPIRVSGLLVGTLDVQSSQLNAFDEVDATMMQAMADQVGVALHNAKLYQEQQRRADQLRTVNEVSKKIAAILSPDELLPFVANIVQETFDYQPTAIFMLDETGDDLILKALTNHENRHDLIGYRMSCVEEGIVQTVARTGDPLLINDVQAHPVYCRDFPIVGTSDKTNSEMAVPIRSAGRVVGVLNIESELRNAFDAIDLTAAQTLADQIGIALENARLYNEVRWVVNELKATNAELEKATQHKSDFLANMSHELRTPLNAIIGFSEILQDQTFGEINDRQRRYVTNILTSGRHLLVLVNDILDLAKVEAGRMELHIEGFAPHEAIGEVENIIAGSAAKKNLILTRELPTDLPVLDADKGKFKQVLYNLLSNAVKFTPDNGTITVIARLTECESVTGLDFAGHARLHKGHGSAPGKYLEIAVRDTGIGIKPDDQLTIFEEFRQVENSFSRQYQGTGLGLALSRSLVELHGGRLWVESELGLGSTFTFSIPLVPPDHAKVNEETLYLAPTNGHADPAPLLVPSGTPIPVQSAIVWAEGMEMTNGHTHGVTIEIIQTETAPLVIANRGMALVVEDDDRSADVLTLYLSQYGYSVKRLRSGDAVTKRVRDLKPDLVTLDVILPHKNGWDILRELKADVQTHAIPVLVISMVDNPELSRSLGASDMLVKPIDRAALFARLNRLAPTG